MRVKVSRRKFLKEITLAAAMFPLARNAGSAYFVNSDQVRLHKDYSVPTICAMCPARCHLLAKVSEGRINKIEGNPRSPFNGRKVCALGQAAVNLIYDPDRLKYPLKRAGERGEGKWTRISWGEAIDTISSHIEQYLNRFGPESMALFAKGPSAAFVREWFAELGVSNINDSNYNQCTISRDSALRLTFGQPPGSSPGIDLKNAACVILIGSHLGENVQIPQVSALMDALDRGAKLIVVDPRVSVVAAKADRHLMIRPGTDTALLLGWINYIIEAGLYDQEYVALHCEGFAELKKGVSAYSLDRVSGITDIPGELIRQTAEMMARCAPAALIYPGRQSGWYGNDVQRVRAQAILTALLGAWDRPGGMFPSNPLPGRMPVAPMTGADGGRADSILQKARRSEIKLLSCWGQNPFQGIPNPFLTIDAFRKADFVFVCDILPSEPSLYADIVLPEAFFLERADILETWIDTDPPAAAIRFPAVSPHFEARDPYWIVKQLAVRLGRGTGFGFDTVLERLDGQLAGLGLSLAKLDAMGGVATFAKDPFPAGEAGVTIKDLEEWAPAGLLKQGAEEAPEAVIGNDSSKYDPSTVNDKIKLFSQSLKEQGMAPVPQFEPVRLPPKGFARLLAGRSPVHSGGATCNNPWLNLEMRENELWLNDEVARFMRIKDGERLFLENEDGIKSLKPVKIKVTPGIRVDCVYMAHGFGSRSPHLRNAYDRGVSDAFLMTRIVSDPISGGLGLRTNFVRFFKDGRPLDIPALDNPPPELDGKDEG